MGNARKHSNASQDYPRHTSRRHFDSGQVITDLKDLINGSQKFQTVYADPPWRYKNRSSRGAAEKHYPTLSLDEIKTLPVSNILPDNAHLHLWTTNAFINDAFDVIKAWGFEYKSCFVWVKPQMGLGNYWRVSHEFLLFAKRGKLKFNDHSLKSWAEFKRLRHSQKPEQIRRLIEKVSPGPYLELFGRRRIPNWTVFGNQVV